MMMSRAPLRLAINGNAAAGRTIGRAAVCGLHPLAHPGQLVAVGAIQARRIGRVAVQFDNMFGRDARSLMEIVYVLGDYARHFAHAVKAGQRPMTSSRLGVAELVAHGEAAPPRLVARFLARQEFVEWDGTVLGPKAARGTKVRDTAFG